MSIYLAITLCSNSVYSDEEWPGSREREFKAKLLTTFYEALAVCQAITDTSSHLILTTSLRGRFYYPHFTDGKRTSKSLSNVILSGIQTEASLTSNTSPLTISRQEKPDRNVVKGQVGGKDLGENHAGRTK